MANKNKIKKLTIAFSVLLLIVIIVKLLGTNKKESTFESQIIDINTNEINNISIYPKSAPESPIELIKKGEEWILSKDNKKFAADIDAAKNILAEIDKMEAKRVISNSKKKWKKYELTDSLATKVVLSKGKDILLELYVGKFSYSQPKGGNPYAQRQISITSYVRKNKDDRIFAVDGMASMIFNREFSFYRNKNIISSDKNKWNEIQFNYQDSTFVLSKKDNKWNINGTETDSTLTINYLNSLQNTESPDFYEGVIAKQQPHFSLKINGTDMKPLKVEAFKVDSAKYLIKSSQNPDATFEDKDANIVKSLFISKQSLFKEEEK